MHKTSIAGGLVALLLFTAGLFGAERFYSVGPEQLVVEGDAAAPNLAGPRVVMDPPAQGFVVSSWLLNPGGPDQGFRLVVRTTSDEPPAGRIIQPANRWQQNEARVVTFKVNAAPSDDAREQFHVARFEHYQGLQWRGGPGAPWFRYLANESRDQLSPERRERLRDRGPWAREPGMTRQYDLFTGGRAVSENLQLDRSLRVTRTNEAEATVDVSSLPGITVAAIDFKTLLGDAKPQLDAVAKLIPADQYAIFFPSHASLIATLDHTGPMADAITNGLVPMGEQVSMLSRYQEMLGVEFDQLARLIGPAAIRSAAITGSDPFFGLGTDVALVLESPSAPVLAPAIMAQIKLSAPEVPAQNQKIGDLECVVFRSADRSISSYVATIREYVVVANSPVQIEALAGALQAKQESLANLAEYQFFRNRYQLGQGDESLLLVIPDAAIRKWCSARWRIADARRIEARARMLDEVAAAVAKGEPRPATVDETYGSLEFSTPIAELKFDKVTPEEADAYNQWRQQYERNWRGLFDPIALRFSVAQQRMAADLTIMPLIAGTDYRQFIDLTRGAKLNPDSGDPHNTLLHFAMALDKESGLLQSIGNQARGMFGLQINPLAWLGQSLAIYVDDDPLWAELSDSGEAFDEEHLPRLPVALRVDSTSPLQLAGFLTAMRGVIEQTAPGLTRWMNFDHAGKTYVRITSAERQGGEVLGNVAVYYAALPDSLLITLSESVLKRALERAAGPAEPGAMKPATQPWLGNNLALQVTPSAVDIARILELDPGDPLRPESEANIAILNEWKRLFPNEDPVVVHERFWKQRLACPAGGSYVWNGQLRTMESTVLGSPDSPKKVAAGGRLFGKVSFANFGVTFENDGLRAQMVVEADPAKLPQPATTRPAK